MPAVIPYPMINGIRYDFSSVIIAINGIKFGGVKSLNYSGTLTPGKLRGNRAQVIGRTRGSYDATGSLEVWKAEWRNMLEALGPGFMEQAFGITAAYSELTTPQLAQLDEIVGCRIVKHEDQMSEGEEPLTVKLDLDIMYVVPNGLVPVSPLQFFK